MTLQWGYQIYTLLHFAVYKSQITVLYCVNKDKPKLHCNGKCYLYQALHKSVFESNQDQFFIDSQYEDTKSSVLASQQSKNSKQSSRPSKRLVRLILPVSLAFLDQSQEVLFHTDQRVSILNVRYIRLWSHILDKRIDLPPIV